MTNLSDWFDSPEAQEFRAAAEKARQEYHDESNAFWDSLTEEQRLLAFYAVVSRIYKADVEDRGTYRWALYDVFGFGMESYGIGMDCGYLDIHNLIYGGLAAKTREMEDLVNQEKESD